MEHRLRIMRDSDPESPREWDNVGIIIAWHDRMTIGEVQVRRHDFNNAEDVRDKCVPDGAVCLPIYLYEHSGCVFSTKPFSDVWDSGQVGWIYTTPEKLRPFYGDTTPDEEEIRKVLEGEIEVYNTWQSGDVWGFVLEQIETCECCGTDKIEQVDSCWGFFGGSDAAREITQYLDEGFHNLVKEAWENRHNT